MKKLVMVWLLLGAAVGGAYYNALRNGFVFDDYLLVVNHPAITKVATKPRLALSPAVVGYRPLRTLSYVLDFRLGGMQPWIFHLSNLVYHWITACVVFLVALQLVTPPTAHCGPRTADSGLTAAVCTALLWVLHPVQTDAVTYVSGRRDILAALFFFLGFYAFLRFRIQPARAAGSGQRAGWLLLACLAYLLGLLSKEMAITLPLIMLCYDYVHEVRLREGGGRWSYVQELGRSVVSTVWNHKFLYLPLLLGGALFSWYAAFIVLPSWKIGWYGGNVVNNFLTVARVWVYYLFLLLYPVRLLADYSGAFPVTHSALDPWALLAIGLLGFLFLLLIAVLRRAWLVAFSGLWIAITLLPVSHIIPHPEMMAEHYLYLPSFGFCLLVAVTLARLMGHAESGVRSPESDPAKKDSRLKTLDSRLWKTVVGYGLVMTLLTFYAARTVMRNRDWRDDLTFYARLVGDNPRSARARLGLGYAYDRNGLPRLAITQYQTGLRLGPQDPRLYTNMGAAYQKLGMLAEAEKAYLASLKLWPQDSKTLNNLGFLYTERKEYDKARSLLEQAEKLSRGQDHAVYANFGLLYEALGELPQALEAYRKARALTSTASFLSAKIAVLEKRLEQQREPHAAGASERNNPASP